MAKKKRDWKAQADRDRERMEAQGLDYDDYKAEQRNRSLKNRALRQWNPTVEARAIELFNQDLPIADINRILESEGLIKVPSAGTRESGVVKKDFRGLRLIYDDLLNDGKLDPSITEFRTSMGSKRNEAATVAQDKKILQHYLESPETFKGKPAQVLAKSYNARYGLTTGTLKNPGPAIAAQAVKRAIEAAIGGKHPEFDEHFKGFQFADFIKGRHENIFPEVKALDKVIKQGLKDGYIMDENLNIADRLKRLKAEYAQAVGKNVNDPKMENEFLGRMRKILNRYIGKEERYNKDLYNTIKDPLSEINSNLSYKNSLLKPTLIALTAQAGQLSNAHMAKALGLPDKDVQLLNRLQQGTSKIARKYKLPINPRSKKTMMAGDHTDMKALMQNYPDYEKNFMRIAYISEGLNTLKSQYDKKIFALYKKALAGHEFDTGTSTKAYMPVAYDKATGKQAQLRGGKFDPDKHERLRKQYIFEGHKTPYSGKLAPGQDYLTIPEAVKKLQNEFSELSGGYKIGGFKIDKPRVMGPDNIILEDPISPRINERASPFAMTIRETLGNLQYGEPGGKRITQDMLNIVDQAIVSPEGATPEGRLNIIKRFDPKDLKRSGYLQSFRVQPQYLPGGQKSATAIKDLLNKGYAEAVKAADTNQNEICSLLGMKRGGLAGGGCGEQMRKALQEAPDETFTKIAEGSNNSARTFAKQILNKIPKGGRIGAVIAGLGAVGAGTWAMMGEAKADDTRTTDQMTFNATEGKFVKPDGDPETQEGILNWIGEHPIISGVAAIPVGMGAGLGADAMNAKNVGNFFKSMKFMLPPAYAAEKLYQYKEGQDLGEMFTNPLDAVWAMALDTKATGMFPGDKFVGPGAKFQYYKKAGEAAGRDVTLGLKSLKPSEWKNLPRDIKTGMMGPRSAGTALVFPFAKGAAPATMGRGMAALRAGSRLLPLGPIPMALMAGSMAWDKYKFNKKIGDHVDALRSQGVVSEEDAETMNTIYKQGWLGTTAIGAKILGSEELMLEGELLDIEGQKRILAGMKDFYGKREDVAAQERVGERQEDFFSWFSEGGRVGMDKGGSPFNVTRRGFLKWLVGSIAAGVAAVSGKGLKQAAKTTTATVAKTPAKFIGVEGMPAWFPRAVAKIKAHGKLIEMADKHYVQGDVYEMMIPVKVPKFDRVAGKEVPSGFEMVQKKVTLEDNPLSGEINMHWTGTDNFGEDAIREINFKPGQAGYQKFGVDDVDAAAKGITEYRRVKVEEPEFSYTQPDQSQPYRDDVEYMDIFTEGDETIKGLEDMTGGKNMVAKDGSVIDVSPEGKGVDEAFQKKIFKDIEGEEAIIPEPEGVGVSQSGDVYGEEGYNEIIEGIIPDHLKKKAEGGIIETGNIARRPGAVPPLSGPTPQGRGILGLFSSPKRVNIT